MDPTDLLLIKMLLRDSRTPYRELAENLKLSVNAVHKRIQALMALGVIERFTVKVSLAALDAMTVVIYGLGRGKMDEVSEAVGRDDRVYWVSQGSGGMVYVGANLRDISELEDLVTLVRTKAQVDDPQVGILSSLPPGTGPTDKKLSRLDLRIVRSLALDARKNVSEISEELNVSAKTVRRHLDRMLSSGLLECSVEWYPDKTNDIISMFHMRLAPSVNRYSFLNDLMTKYGLSGLFVLMFSNIPDTVLFCTWSSNMKEVNEVRRQLDGEEDIVSSVPYILYGGQVYPTWRDRLGDETSGGC
ncbi:MAG: winged helix-turn-helix transcriptional regulator [Methanomassiliicoccus sp.]|nr:winged helix-turn-helix transcriptional regulator [Methanomassiliicoccus sp.]